MFFFFFFFFLKKKDVIFFFFFFQAEDGIRGLYVTGVQTCALPICAASRTSARSASGWPARATAPWSSTRRSPRPAARGGWRKPSAATEGLPGSGCLEFRGPHHVPRSRRS